MTGMILAAGLGTRLGELTSQRPKALIEVDGVSMLDIIAQRMLLAGYNHIIVNVHHQAETLTDHLNKISSKEISWVVSDETGKLLDTGGAIKKAVHMIGNQKFLLVHNSDILTNADLTAFIKAHEKAGNDLTLMVKERPTSRYLLVNENQVFSGWENPLENIRIVKPGVMGNLSRIAYSGIYVLSSTIFTSFPDEDVFGLFQWLLKLDSHIKIGTWNQGDSIWYEIGRPDSLETARNNLVVDLNSPEVIREIA